MAPTTVDPPRSGKIGPVGCQPLQPAELPDYLDFAAKSWGRRSHQALKSRLTWLYDHNPWGGTMGRDLLIAQADGRIVGCHHRMRLPWRVAGGRQVFPSLHDLMVLPDYRSGAGTQLVLAALAGESRLLLAGLSPSADAIYDRLRAPVMRCHWLRKWFVTGRALTHGLGALFNAPSSTADFTASAEDGYTVEVHAEPSSETLRRALLLTGTAEMRVDWDEESFRWRFFHDLGPRHCLILLSRHGEVIGRAVISVGRRRGLRVARWVDAVVEEDSSWEPLAQAVDTAICRTGSAIGLVATNSETAARQLSVLGWRPRKRSPGVRFFDRSGSTASIALWGGAWDFGFDLPC